MSQFVRCLCVFSLCWRRIFVTPVHECAVIFPVGCSQIMDCVFKIALSLGSLAYFIPAGLQVLQIMHVCFLLMECHVIYKGFRTENSICLSELTDVINSFVLYNIITSGNIYCNRFYSFGALGAGS